jgi:hypothetical protein
MAFPFESQDTANKQDATATHHLLWAIHIRFKPASKNQRELDRDTTLPKMGLNLQNGAKLWG